jgi:hypothetical protein
VELCSDAAIGSRLKEVESTLGILQLITDMATPTLASLAGRVVGASWEDVHAKPDNPMTEFHPLTH